LGNLPLILPAFSFFFHLLNVGSFLFFLISHAYFHSFPTVELTLRIYGFSENLLTFSKECILLQQCRSFRFSAPSHSSPDTVARCGVRRESKATLRLIAPKSNASLFIFRIHSSAIISRIFTVFTGIASEFAQFRRK
ncbi:MAG: hypothetical protein IJW40_10950, partial [Clostridia bacterium]|nr:hypothetical protein [Clostridia bacterium]